MRDNLWLGLFTVVFVVGIVMLATLARPHPALPPEINCVILDADPAFFAGREVRVRTDGMESVGGELVYRKRSDQPPIVVLRFKGTMPTKLPPVVTGLCLGRQGAVVLVVNCQP